MIFLWKSSMTSSSIPVRSLNTLVKERESRDTRTHPILTQLCLACLHSVISLIIYSYSGSKMTLMEMRSNIFYGRELLIHFESIPNIIYNTICNSGGFTIILLFCMIISFFNNVGMEQYAMSQS